MTETTLDPRLEAIETAIRAHPGEFILIVNHREASRQARGGLRTLYPSYTREVHLSLGILASDTSNFSLATSDELPTTKYARTAEWWGGTFYVQQGACKMFLIGLLTRLQLRVTYTDKTEAKYHPDDHSLDLIVGDEAVMTAFRPTKPASEFVVDYHPIWLQRAAKLLGQPLAGAPELEAADAAELEGLLERLWSIEQRVAPERLRLQEMRRARQSTGVLIDKGGATLVEDDDDLLIVSLGPRQAIDKANTQMKTTLDQLVERGAAEHPYVVAFKLRYQL